MSATTTTAIGYLRVSTREQGRSALGLAAQRHEIEAFGAREGFSVKSWHQDVQTGKGADALLLRPWGACQGHREAASGSKALEKAGTVATRHSCSGVTRYVSHKSSAG